MLKRPRTIALMLVAVLTVGVLSMPHRWMAHLKLGLGAVFLPLFGLAGSSHALAEKAGDALVPRQTLTRELETLRRENQRLQIRLQETEEIQRENDRIRDQLGVSRQAPAKWKYARVIGRDPANWWRSLLIDLGSRDGLRPNLVVRTPEGLVGRVATVGSRRSQVLLVGDPNCGVAAMVLETRDTTGIITPPSIDTYDNRMVDLTRLSSSNIKPGQRVVTSGQGGALGVFPKGIPVGEIAYCRVMEFGLFAEARVKLAVDFNRLEEVWVLMP